MCFRLNGNSIVRRGIEIGPKRHKDEASIKMCNEERLGKIVAKPFVSNYRKL